MTPRGQCYHAIRHAFSASIAEYYQKYPDKLKGPDSEAHIAGMLKLMANVMLVLDECELTKGSPE